MNTEPTMKTRLLVPMATLCLLATGSFGTAKADVVSSITDGPDTSNGAFYWGETVETIAGGPWDQLSFNFYNSAGAPQAVGDIYLLSEQYLGAPDALSSATPGFIAEGSASGGAYDFSPGVTVDGSTEYWVYTDAALELTGNGAGNYQFTSFANTDFSGAAGNGINYTLNGSESPIPEPTGLLLLGTVVGLVGLTLRRKLAGSR